MTDKDFELLIEKAKGFQEAIDEVKADTNSMQHKINCDKAERMKKLNMSLDKICEIMRGLKIEKIQIGIGEDKDNRILELRTSNTYRIKQAYIRIDGIQGSQIWWNLDSGNLSVDEYCQTYNHINETLHRYYKAYHYPDWTIFNDIINDIDRQTSLIEQAAMYVIEAELQDRMQKALNENKKVAVELKGYKFN